MNNRIEVITDRILADAAAERDAILASAQREADAIRASYEKRAESLLAEAAESAERQKKAAQERAEASAKTLSRNALLRVRGEMVNAAFLRAAERLSSLDKEHYLAFLKKLLSDAVEDFLLAEAAAKEYGEEEDFAPVEVLSLTMAEKDKALGAPLAASVEKRLKQAGKKIVTSPADPALSGGFCLTAGDVLTDCSISSLVAAKKGELEGEVNRLLFS